MTPFEYYYDDHTLFLGEIVEEDESFDHAFGTEKRSSFKVEDFTIVVFIQEMEHDVTVSIEQNSPKLFELYKNKLLEEYEASLL